MGSMSHFLAKPDRRATPVSSARLPGFGNARSARPPAARKKVYVHIFKRLPRVGKHARYLEDARETERTVPEPRVTIIWNRAVAQPG
jgi:hypothetical protein